MPALSNVSLPVQDLEMETSDAEEPPVVGRPANRTNYKSDRIEMLDSAEVEWLVKQTATPW